MRLAQPADAPEVARLLDAFNREFDSPTPGPEVLTARLEALLATESTAAFLALDPGVGLALVTLRSNVWSDGPVALLDELYVEPAMRGRGIGSALIEEVLVWARARGAALLEVNVDQEDADALRFYARHGVDQEHAFYLARVP